MSICPAVVVSEAPPCPICGRATRRVNAAADYAYWRCASCQSAHLHPQPSADFLAAFYDTFHLSHSEGGVFGDFETRSRADFPAKARIVVQTLRDHRFGSEARVLDVGCGKGQFVAELQRHGLEAEGIDCALRAVAEGTRQGVPGLQAGELSGCPSWHDRFDAVTSWATIEHVPCGRAFLRSIASVLRPGGLLFLDTGLAGDAVERWAPGLVQWYDAPQHLFVFSRAGMEKLLAETGFRILRLDPPFERSAVRRIAKFLRNRILALAGRILFRLGLGPAGYASMRQESRLPLGSLLFIVAQREGAS